MSDLLTPDGIPRKKVEPKEPEAPPKGDDVNIVSISAAMQVTPMGQPATVIYGGGDDNKLYMFNFSKDCWVIAKGKPVG